MAPNNQREQDEETAQPLRVVEQRGVAVAAGACAPPARDRTRRPPRSARDEHVKNGDDGDEQASLAGLSQTGSSSRPDLRGGWSFPPIMRRLAGPRQAARAGREPQASRHPSTSSGSPRAARGRLRSRAASQREPGRNGSTRGAPWLVGEFADVVRGELRREAEAEAGADSLPLLPPFPSAQRPDLRHRRAMTGTTWTAPRRDR